MNPKYRRATVGPWIPLGRIHTKRARCYICQRELTGEQLVYSGQKQAVVVGQECMRKFEAMLKNPEGKNPVSLYQSFHGVKESRLTKVYYKEPEGELLKVGDLTEIRYKPTFPSKHTGVEFSHRSGDTGQSILKTNLVLATDREGGNLYLVKKTRNKRPYFSRLGIIG